MKWGFDRDFDGQHLARCGHLYVRIEEVAAYKEPDCPDYEPSFCEWFVEPDDEPDDEDKSYRRALKFGRVATVDEAKHAAVVACQQIVAAMLESLEQ